RRSSDLRTACTRKRRSCAGASGFERRAPAGFLVRLYGTLAKPRMALRLEYSAAGGVAVLKRPQIGVYGLGTMGSALALNMAENGIEVAIANRELDWLQPFMADAGPLANRLHPETTLEGFVASLAPPRVILFMIPAGAPMDAMIAAITPLLAPGDTIIDGGNADFHVTRQRSKA